MQEILTRYSAASSSTTALLSVSLQADGFQCPLWLCHLMSDRGDIVHLSLDWGSPCSECGGSWVGFYTSRKLEPCLISSMICECHVTRLYMGCAVHVTRKLPAITVLNKIFCLLPQQPRQRTEWPEKIECPVSQQSSLIPEKLSVSGRVKHCMGRGALPLFCICYPCWHSTVEAFISCPGQTGACPSSEFI